MKIFIVALLLAIGYAQTDENPWTCRNEEQNKFDIEDINTNDEKLLKKCLQPIYAQNFGPSEAAKICSGGSCWFKGCCWDKVKSTGGVECANPDPNTAANQVHRKQRGCVYECETTAYGSRSQPKFWHNKVLVDVTKYEYLVEQSQSNVEVEIDWIDVGDKNAVQCTLDSSSKVKACSEDSVESNDLQVDVKEWDCGVCDVDGAPALRKACCESCGNMIKEEGLNQEMRYLICKNCPNFPYPTDYSQIIDTMRSYVKTAIVDMQADIIPSILPEYPHKYFRGHLQYDVETAGNGTGYHLIETGSETCIANLTSRILYENQKTTVHWGGCSTCDASKQASCCRQCSQNNKAGGYLVCHGCDKKELQNGQGYLDDAVNQIVEYYSGMYKSTDTGKSSSLPIFASFILLLLSFL